MKLISFISVAVYRFAESFQARWRCPEGATKPTITNLVLSFLRKSRLLGPLDYVNRLVVDGFRSANSSTTTLDQQQGYEYGHHR